MNNKVTDLFDTVIKNDYCIGCGICASVKNSPLKMCLNSDGKYSPHLDKLVNNSELEIDIKQVCPFSNNSKDETDLGKQLYGDKISDINFNNYTGYYLKNYAGYVKEGNFRQQGSSGGMANWIATQLLKDNLVDGIIHVKETIGKTPLFEYQISFSVEDISKGAKSKYYPIEMSKVLEYVKRNEGRYALIGIPCFIKGVRLLAEQDKEIAEKIKYYIGLVCGHLKSDMFAKSIGWQLGIDPSNLTSIDFRKKINNRAANDYGVEVKGTIDSKQVIKTSPTRDLYTTNWGHGLFKYNACEFCDDVLAETADVTVGDAWLPEYSKDSMGTNIIVVRNPDIHKLFEKNIDKLHIEEISVDKVYQSQAAGFRHRRDGLAYRLYLKDKNNEWRPIKRVQAANNLDSKRKLIYEKRMQLSKESFKAYKLAEDKNDFKIFIKYMDPYIREYNKLVSPTIVKRVINKVKKELKTLTTR